jgi:D-alanine-D-alanine ligase
MNIGLTYDLRSEYLAAGYGEEETAEFDSEETIAALERTIQDLGHRTVRIGGARRLVERLAAGDRWDLVFNIAEGLHGFGRESQVPAILDVYEIPYTFSDPLVLAVSLHKATAKSVVRAAGVPTPDFKVVEHPADLDTVDLPFPLFAKPVAEGTGKGVTAASVLNRPEDVRPYCEQLWREYRQPVLLETFLPGREFTVGILGTDGDAVVLGTLEVVLLAGADAAVYSFLNKELCESRVEYCLVKPESDEEVRQAEAVALAVWRALGCRDGGRVDIRSDARGNPQFMEVNPLAGLHPSHSDLPILCTRLGISYKELIGRILQSAGKRATRT